MRKTKPKRQLSAKKRKATPQRKRGDAYQDAVATVARNIDPSANVEVGQWIRGPDGRRDLDVVIRPKGSTSSAFTVIECKDWNRPIGIAFIDALESKRRDIGASAAMICSNSGFTADALRKAARVGIAALAALIHGDQRIRVIVRQQIYTQHVNFLFHAPNFFHPVLTEADKKILEHPTATLEWSYKGKSIEAWVSKKLLEIVAYPVRGRSLVARYQLRVPLGFRIRGVEIPVSRIEIRTAFTVQWKTQVAKIGASQGMYDYLRKVVLCGIGPNEFNTTIDSETWGSPISLDEVPQKWLTPEQPSPGVGPTMRFLMLDNMPASDPKDAADIDPFVISHEIIDLPEN